MHIFGRYFRDFDQFDMMSFFWAGSREFSVLVGLQPRSDGNEISWQTIEFSR